MVGLSWKMEAQAQALLSKLRSFDRETIPSPTAMLSYALQILSLTSLSLSTAPLQCKAVPGTPSWPSDSEWTHLNTSLGGKLIRPVPPGAVCHPSQPTFDLLTCPSVQLGWLSTAWHADDPVSTPENNWNNDTCLPNPMNPCSGEGYPVYVVNATTSKDVKSGVDFARKKGVRLIVKGTGHDYLGRSSAPNSLSIWTHHMRGLVFHDGFTPKGCKAPIDGHAITAAAGTQMLELDEEASLRNLTIVSGGAGTVGVGGYLTGGGHGALSSTYGLGADQVLEMEIVTPGGEILTVNECHHEDLFWAMRGGGGSTFGVLTSVTIKAYPSSPFLLATGFLATAPGTDAYWDVIVSLLSQYPALDAQGISAYSMFAPSFIIPSDIATSTNITGPIDGYIGIFMIPALHSSNTTDSLVAAVQQIFNTATSPYPFQFYTSITPTSYPDFWAFYKDGNGPLDGGHDQVLGSRLLDIKALTGDGNLTFAKQTWKEASMPGSLISAFLVGGHGVMNAEPRGGGNAVNPAWRRAYVHAISGDSWFPFDTAGKTAAEDYVTNTYGGAMRKLAPDMGSYVNEADPNEPNFQESFWGCNYPRLQEIKRKYDPEDTLWCTPCVGNERWEEVGDMLCRV